MILTFVLLLLPLMALPRLVPLSQAASRFAPHAAILIDGNSGFIQSNGVTGGHGTVSDPFVIEGWDMAGQNGGIAIRNTDAYLVIRNVYFHSYSGGISLYDLTNVRIENSLFTDQSGGVYVGGAVNVTISHNNMTRTEYGVYVEPDLLSMVPQGSSYVYVTDNNIWNGTVGVLTVSNPRTPRVNITSNNIGGNSNAGVEIGSTNAIIAKNNLTRNFSGIFVSSTVDSLGNLVSSPVITDNYIAFNARGIFSAGAVGLTLAGNTLVHNGFQISTSSSKYPGFYDSHTIPPTNMIDGKPILYLSNCHDSTIDGQPVAEIVVGSCDNVRLANLQLWNANVTAIQMGFVHNVTLANVSLMNDVGGVAVEWSDKVSILQSSFASCLYTPISIHDTGNVSIRENLFSSNRFGSVQLSTVSNLLVSSNNVTDDLGPGFGEIAVSDATSMLIANNTVRSSDGTALVLTRVVNATIFQNSIGGNLGGISVTSVNGLNITANSVFYNEVGLTLFSAGVGDGGIFNTIIYHNNFAFNRDYQLGHYVYTVFSLDNGYPSGGNYWSNFNGTDNCSGPQQDFCNGPDGIGDSPYRGLTVLVPIFGGVERGQSSLFDRYPLMKPYGDFSSDTIPPSWPVGAVLSYSVGGTNVSLSWPAASDDSWVQSYNLYENGALLGTVAGNVHDYSVTGLLPRTSYTFRVEAKDVAGEISTNGPSATVTTGSRSGTPGPTGRSTSGNTLLNGFLGLIELGLGRNYPFVIVGIVAIGLLGALIIVRPLRRHRRG